MREVYAELQTRTEVLAKLPKAAVPDNKVTPELARTNRRLRPLVLVIDEAQEVFSHGDYGDEAGKLAEGIIKRGRALGVIAVFATQRPDAKSLPTGVSTNVGVRFCLRVMDQTANDMVLGTSSYKNGIRAMTFTPRDKGIGYLVGVGDEPQVVRTFHVDTVAAEKVAERARAARERAGTLTGYALGEESPKTAAASLLEDLALIFATIEVEKVWREDVVTALAERWPDRYGQLTPDALTAALRPLGITTGQVWGRLPDGPARTGAGSPAGTSRPPSTGTAERSPLAPRPARSSAGASTQTPSVTWALALSLDPQNRCGRDLACLVIVFGGVGGVRGSLVCPALPRIGCSGRGGGGDGVRPRPVGCGRWCGPIAAAMPMTRASGWVGAGRVCGRVGPVGPAR
jgi:hypothetical protein